MGSREEALQMKIRDNKKPESKLVIKDNWVYLQNIKKCVMLSTKKELIQEISLKYDIPIGEFVERSKRKAHAHKGNKTLLSDSNVDRNMFGKYNNHYFIMCGFGAIIIEPNNIKCLHNNEKISDKKVLDIKPKFTHCYLEIKDILKNYTEDLKKLLYKEIIRLEDLDTAKIIYESL